MSSGRRTSGLGGSPLVGLALSGLALSGLAGCRGSAGGGGAAVHSVTPAQGTVVTAPPATVTGQVPTVFDCGGGAYEPATLLVVCGSGVNATMVTAAHWSAWSAAGATGTGTVHLAARSATATITLDAVVPTDNGPQFSILHVTWSAGSSPDGRTADTFRLATAPAPG
jgi:hypothetical protein